MSFHAYMPLERGLLTGNVKRDYVIQPGDAREDSLLWKPGRFQEVLDFVDELNKICEDYHCTCTHLAIAFLHAQGEDINVISGARRVFQVEDIAKALEVKLEEGDIREIEKLMAKYHL